MIAYLAGDAGSDTEALEAALEDRVVSLPPVVLTEILSDPKMPEELSRFLRELPLLATTEGFWERAAELRRKVLAEHRRARLADTLIAQSCLDHDASLITRDHDFQSFSRIAPLKLIPSR